MYVTLKNEPFTLLCIAHSYLYACIIIHKMVSLRGIAISHSRVTDKGVIHLVSSLPNISIVNMSDCNEVTGKSLPFIFYCLPYLEQLFIAGCTNITKNYFPAFEARFSLGQ